MKRIEIKDAILKATKVTVLRTTQGTGPDGKGVELDATEKPKVVSVPGKITLDSAIELVTLGKAEIGDTTKKKEVPK